MRRLRYQLVMGSIFGVIGLAVLVLAWWFIIQQHIRLATYQSVPAKIISSKIAVISGKHTSYRADISYTFELAGKTYTSDRVMPLGNNSSGSYSSAQKVRDQYPPKKRATAWISPSDPSKSFLIHEPEIYPFLLAFFGLPFFAVGTVMITVYIGSGRPPTRPRPTTAGWFTLTLGTTTVGKLRLALFITFVWCAYCLAALGDYYVINGRVFDLMLKISTIVGGALALVSLAVALRFWRLQHDYLDPDLQVDCDHFRVGQTFHVRIRQSMLTPLQILEASAGAVCTRYDRVRSGGSTNYSQHEDWSFWQPFQRPGGPAMETRLEGQTALTISDLAKPTGSMQGVPYPYYVWHIVLRIKAQGQPKLDLHFPIIVQAAT